MLNVEKLNRGLTPSFAYRTHYLPSIDKQSGGLDDTFEDCSYPSYIFNADSVNSIDPINYLPSVHIKDIKLFDKVKNMSNPNFIAQYREPSLSPSRHPGYKLKRPEYRPGFLTSRSNTQYGDMTATSRAMRNMATDDIALYRPGRIAPSERSSRPLARHQARFRSISNNDDYIHSRGVFTSTTPNVRGHFIIHPDWVSERMTPRK